MAPGGGAREGDTQGGAHGCAAGAAARRAGRFHVQQRRSWGAAALLVPLASRGCRCSQREQEAEVDFANVSRQAQLVGMVGAHKQGKGPRAREEKKQAS